MTTTVRTIRGRAAVVQRRRQDVGEALDLRAPRGARRSKSIIRFTEPAEVDGVALLIVNHAERASDQWMWTPALQRDRRIALQDRSTRFFGTDFSFEDLEERVAAQYEHTLLDEETIDGVAAWKIQAVARRTRSSQYTKQILWIRKTTTSPCVSTPM